LKEEMAAGRDASLDDGNGHYTPVTLMPHLTPLPQTQAVANVSSGDLARSGKTRSEEYFQFMRERVRVLAASSPTAVMGYYAKNQRENPAFDTTATRYGYALAQVRARQPEKAIAGLEKLVARQPDNVALQLALADAQDQAGQSDAAQKRCDRLHGDHPGNRAITLAYADSLLARADKARAQRAQNLLRPLLDDYSDDPDLQTSFARSCELSGDKVRAGEAYADAAYLNGHAEDALNQLKALAKQSDLDYYQRARIDARITSLTPLVLELRRHGNHSAPDPNTDSLHSAAACDTRLCFGVSSGSNNPRLQ
ncbi:MAG: tetratricopeptide repeat protein, partial [Dokdonella sp.]